jgi:putative ABC transport system ATP-binding protein
MEKGSTNEKGLVRFRRTERVYQVGDRQVHALHPLDLTIEADEFVMILGPSGSGKTTLLNLLAGMDSPTGGSLQVGDLEVSSLSRSELVEYRRQKVGVVFQFFNLIPNLTALENIQFVSELTGTGGDAVKALHSVGLDGRRHHFPHELSGGEQQRVAIARALVKEPPILLGDEPTGNLDMATGQKILGLFQEIYKQGRCVILVTHNRAITRAATRVITLGDGRIRSDERNDNPVPAQEIDW